MHAVDDLSDAIDVTRDLLMPFRLWLWLKLAVVVLFVGGIGLGGSLPFDPGLIGETGQTTDIEPTAQVDLGLILLVAGVILTLWILIAVISAIMEFVFLESLRSNQVSIRAYASAHLNRGLRLFGFRLGLQAAAVGLVGLPAYLAVTAGSLGVILVVGLWGIVVGLSYTIISRFTSEFVAPVMLLESRGVFDGWRRFSGTLRSHWTEYLVYLLLVWILQLVVNVAVGIMIFLVIFIVAIPFVILALVFALLGPIGIALFVPIAILGGVIALLGIGTIQMPFRTYFQYYALLVLGDTNESLDLIPDQRRAVRHADREGAPDDDDDGDELPGWDREDPDPWDDSEWESASDRTDDEQQRTATDDESDDWGWTNASDWDRPPEDDDR